MTKSGIYDNFSGDHPNVCMGQTIFGLTSTTGQSDIHDINFATSVDNYLSGTLGIRKPYIDKKAKTSSTYNTDGTPSRGSRGIVVTKGKKYVVK